MTGTLVSPIERVADVAHALDGARLLIAYANESTFVSTTREYLESFARYSHASVRYVHVTAEARIGFDLDSFDIVLQSYCARLPFPGLVSTEFRDKLRSFRGVKLLSVQDEYDYTDILRAAIKEIGYHVVFTCVPHDQVALVYPPEMFPDTEFVTVLTGYVPETSGTRQTKPVPLPERPIIIGYRGRDIGARYGRLAFDKFEIGRRMRDICLARRIPHDIGWTDDKRIYGDAWYGFIASCRAVLGSESGSNVFDFDGSIAAKYRSLSEQRPTPVSYEEFRTYTDPIEARFDIGQISPRVFEAAALRTPMILYSGRYSGIIEPDEHYVELKKDFSNIDTVLARLDDLNGLAEMAERTHAHLIGSGAFDYRRFISTVETVMARKAVELNLLPRRHAHPPLPPEPPTDWTSLASLDETPTRRPRDVVHFYYKMQALENRELKEQIALLTAEVTRLNSTAINLSQVSAFKAALDAIAIRVDVVATILADAAGRSALAHCVQEPRAGKRFLVDVARLILARKITVTSEGKTEPTVLIPYLSGDGVNIITVPDSVAVELNFFEYARAALDDTLNRGFTSFLLIFGRNMSPRPPLIVGDSHPLLELPRWLKRHPKLIAGLILGTNGASASPRSEYLPSSATHYFEFLTAAARHPDLVPLLHDLDHRRIGTPPAPPFDRPQPPPRPVPAVPRQRSVLFLHHNYYHHLYLARALRRRGWDALCVSLDAPDSPSAPFFHGEDLSLWDADPARFREKLNSFFDTIGERFARIHMYGHGLLGLFPVNWESSAPPKTMPWDLLELAGC